MMPTQKQNQQLPAYLAKYVVEQDYERYTALEHATWRYIMRQSTSFFAKHAVGIYLEGLTATGIPVDRIPRISEMNDQLSKFGWGAVGVEGFIPSSVFLDLLARRQLPIATDMRTIEHVGYTPAPDIVHEAAGHAPIIADPAYRRFLESYALLAHKALISKGDIDLYESIRLLSDVKENPDCSVADIVQAESQLRAAYRQYTQVSEAGKVARLAWWTIEYGLVGNMQNPQIYGAGLLSSVAESHSCLESHVKKIPLSLDCVETGYDITEPQPQLFVAKNLEQLPEILHALEKTFSFSRGGRYGLQSMLEARTINSIFFEQGLSISGVLTEYVYDDAKNLPEFIRLSGRCQICCNETQMHGQGPEQHPEGFSTPLGFWRRQPLKNPSLMNANDLDSLGLRVGHRAQLELTNGFSISGELTRRVFHQDRLLLLQWKDCTVQRGDRIYFDPSWGTFDQPIATQIASVCAGPADRAAYGDYDVGSAKTKPGRISKFSVHEKQWHAAHAQLAKLRDLVDKPTLEHFDQIEQLARYACEKFGERWLVAVEIQELIKRWDSQLGNHRQKVLSWSNKLNEISLRSEISGSIRHQYEAGCAV